MVNKESTMTAPRSKEFLLSGPDLSVLDLERPKEMPRNVDL